MRSTLITATLLALSTATVSAASVTTFAGAKNADMSKIVIANLPTDGSDASARLQEIIDSNPNRTIYIPDGTYIMANPVRTCGKTDRTVALQLSDKTVLKAAPSWNSDKAMITLGTPKEENTTARQGYFYFLDGGTVDCSGVAKGVAVECGRNIQVRNMNIVDTPLGFAINNGTNGGSSDADIFNLTIKGNNQPGSTGVYIHGWDNTISNITVTDVQTGIYSHGGGGVFRDINLTCGNNPAIQNESCGMLDLCSDNWIVNFDVKGFARAFSFENAAFLRPLVDNTTVSFKGCKAPRHTVFANPNGGFHAFVRNLNVKTAGKPVDIVTEKSHDGKGRIAAQDTKISNPADIAGRDHIRYMRAYDDRDLAACRMTKTGDVMASSFRKLPSKTVIANVNADGRTDVADQLQNIIDASPGATIYLPDGKYALGKTLRTSSKNGKNVALRLANFAIIFPLDGFQGEYLMDLGADCAGNAPTLLEGGTVDCLGKTKGVNMTSGKNGMIRYTTFLHAPEAIHIGKDAVATDIFAANTEGQYTPECVGVVVDGPDTNVNLMRINDVRHGMIFRSSGNIARNIHPLTYNHKESWEGTCGVIDEAGGNYYDYYYPDHFSIGFYLKNESNPSVLNNCFCYHYTNVLGLPYSYYAIKTDGPFNSYFSNSRTDFTNHCDINGLVNAGQKGGKGTVSNEFINTEQNITDHSYRDYFPSPNK